MNIYRQSIPSNDKAWQVDSNNKELERWHRWRTKTNLGRPEVEVEEGGKFDEVYGASTGYLKGFVMGT